MKITGDEDLSPEIQEAIKTLAGTWLCDGQVELLTHPTWESGWWNGNWGPGRWVALANAFGMLCLIEVSLRLKDVSTHADSLSLLSVSTGDSSGSDRVS